MYKKKHIHFIGIGGIGMSGIAAILKSQGHIISGCDIDLDQESIRTLEHKGCILTHGHGTDLCADPTIEIVVYTNRIKPDHPEIIAAQKRGIITIHRALMLAELMRTKYSVAVTGSHGKTTTTSLISHLLIEALTDPTIIVGGYMQSLTTNARYGLGDLLVTEADESDRSLLFLRPSCAVITNISLEHLETYHDLEDIKHTFRQFLQLLPFYGHAFVCGDDENIIALLPIPPISTLTYGIKSHNDIIAYDIQLHSAYSYFSVRTKEGITGHIHLPMPGSHNVLNALAAIAVALSIDVPFAIIARAFTTFRGVDQRFTIRGTYQGAKLIDDYGHHPKEVAAALSTTRTYTTKKICVIFQAHKYTRTYYLWNEFVTTFLNSSIDHLIITDIFPCGEQPIPGVTGQLLLQAIESHNPSFTSKFIPYYSDQGISIEAYVEQNAHHYDVILFLGAGKTNIIAKQLIEKQKYQPSISDTQAPLFPK